MQTFGRAGIQDGRPPFAVPRDRADLELIL
jgi:hypothetical protein